MSIDWSDFLRLSLRLSEPALTLDLAGMGIGDADLDSLDVPMEAALSAMERLEGGAEANASERRMVGHYWLRAPGRAPNPEIRAEIEGTLAAVDDFARRVRDGDILAPSGGPFRKALFIGIGGSALGPQLLAAALRDPLDPLQPYFLDNTDPQGFARTFQQIGDGWPETLVVVASKSGGTRETRNGMLAAEAEMASRGLPFAPSAVAVTGAGSLLDEYARSNQWLARFPMWDWVGGRTSLFSAVGLLPAGLLGLPIYELLAGAASMDAATRRPEWRTNPAALLAAAWYLVGDGRGERNMVVLPYRDQLELFSRYLQQLVMESLGKRENRQGQIVHQGITVLGNKGSTDQHAYVQQLRDGRSDFFVTFIEVLNDDAPGQIEVEPGVTAGDYLHGFLQGTRSALAEAGRPSLTLTIPHLDSAAFAALIALFERAVGLYAELIDINAYDQPGVEAGKKAATGVIDLQHRALKALAASPDPLTAPELAADLGGADAYVLYGLLRHLSANGSGDVEWEEGDTPAEDRFQGG